MTQKVSFTLPAEYVANAASGILLGEFNHWNPGEAILLQKQSDGSMFTELVLTAGKTYEYRYLLSDGRWVNDNNEKKFSDVFGTAVENCLVNVPIVEKEIVTSGDTIPDTGEKIISGVSKLFKRQKTSLPVPADDLTKLDGIDKKINTLLVTHNVRSFKDLSRCSIKKLQLILDGAGGKFSSHNPASWPKQARLAVNGKWEELNKLQEELKARK